MSDTEQELRAQEQVTAAESYWRYPATGLPKHQPPSGEVWLLTEGRIGVPGKWSNEGGFIAWAPKIQRDKDLEKRLGLL